MQYRVMFIDEERQTLDDFLDYVDRSPHKGTISPLPQLPLSEIEEMTALILELNPDVIITDYMLNDSRESINYNVSYNGTELVHYFQSIREGFPCFVLTAFDDQAINESADVNIVYIKHLMYDQDRQKAKADFLDRVINQIKHYRARIESAEKELTSLLELRECGKTTIKDDERLLELDTFLEHAIDKRLSIPNQYKTLANSEKLSQLIVCVDKLIDEIDNGSDE